MITLSLDEFGDFEGLKGENKAILIGGVLYDDKDVQNDLALEYKRIRAYYEEVFKEASTKLGRTLEYPRALHEETTHNKKEEKIVSSNVGTIKSIVTETLGEFIKEGTFRGREPQYINGNQIKVLPKRAGKYYLYAILKSEKGKEERLQDNVGSLGKDNYASNLYFHMASEALNRTIFQNPYLPSNSAFNLKIATRSSGNIDRNSKIAQEYKKLGYTGTKKKKLKDGTTVNVTLADGTLAVYYELTNIDIYRTALEQYLMGKNKNNSTINDLSVESIVYKNPDLKQEMLYLADSVCSIFSFGLTNKERPDESSWLVEIYKRGNELVAAEDFLLFAYDQADVDYSAALEAYFNDDYYTALKIIYEARHKKGAFYKFYSDTWFSYIEKQIENTTNKYAFKKAVKDLYDSQKTNTYVHELGMYIFHELEKVAKVMKTFITAPEEQSIFYYLYETAMISYCHIGNSAEAASYYLKAKKYASTVSTEEFIRTRSIIVNLFCDSFEWEKAKKIAEENVDYAQLVIALKRHIDDQVFGKNSTIEGKAYSQLGQICALMRDKKAEDCFKKALMLLPDKSADYFITESYLLHYYIDTNNKKKYEDYAYEYFGGTNNLLNQLKYMQTVENDEPVISKPYAMYVYIKALYMFYLESISDKLWEELRVIKNLRSHPAEMIYKYLSLIAISRGEKQLAKKFASLLKGCIHIQGGILNAIVGLSLYDCYRAIENDKKANKNRVEALTVLEDSFPVFENISNMDAEAQDELISSHFTYMYN